MPQKNEETTDTAFKNWINEALVKRMAKHISHHYPAFDDKAFIKLSHKLPELELKPRMRLICDFLKTHLPEDYKKALAILLKATTNPATGIAPLKGFDLWAFTEYVHRYGLKDFDESMKALHTFTELFTAEFAIRPFLIHEEKRTLKVLHTWSKDKNHHVRRLVSEGSRPRLPWGEQLKSFIKDPAPTIELLDKLKYDDELYVRKSVANHLNDISKDHAEIAIKTAARWLKEAPAKHQDKIDWIVRHALRTLIKKGNPAALKLLGYDSNNSVKIKNLKLNKSSVNVGDHLEFSFDIESSKPGKIMVDYLVHHKKSNGNTSPKVFKLTSKDVKAKEVFNVRKKHSFKPVTTRVYYPGTHYLEIMVNGKLYSKVPFKLAK